MIKVIIQNLNPSSENVIPSYATIGSAGFDLIAANTEDITLKPMQRKLIPTGMAMEIPQNYEVQVRPRSGLALKHGITVLNTPGTIDSDYRGEICVILINLGEENFIVQKGMRIAQGVLAEVKQANFLQENELSSSDRGKKGFGSTGK